MKPLSSTTDSAVPPASTLRPGSWATAHSSVPMMSASGSET